MDSSLRRRRFIAVTATGAVGLLTGCTGDGNGDGNGGDDGTDDSTDGETGDGEDGQGDDDMTDGGDDGDGSGVSDPVLRDAFGITEQFAFDVEAKGEQQATASGRFYQGDTYIQVDFEDGAAEFYEIGDDQYMVSSSQGEEFCIQNPDRTPPDEGQVDPDDYESDVSEYPDLTPVGRDTIDGEEVYVYELTPEETGGTDTITYYVSVDSGYLRRVESPEAVVNFHSWNDVEPVEAPDMECNDMSQMPGGSDIPTSRGSP